MTQNRKLQFFSTFADVINGPRNSFVKLENYLGKDPFLCLCLFLSRKNSMIFHISSLERSFENEAITVPVRPLEIVLNIMESVGL